MISILLIVVWISPDVMANNDTKEEKGARMIYTFQQVN